MKPDHGDDDRTQEFTILAKGSFVSHYEIIEFIGAGGMGEVYLAEDTGLNRKVALKVLPAQFTFNEDFKARFRREAQAAASLNHPNIVTIHDVGEHQGRPFFVMEHIKGMGLDEAMKCMSPTLDQMLEMFMHLGEALDKAHSAGIVHRDIKPSNIMVDCDKQPKILDFGLATVKGGEKLTQAGSTLGTLGYMSPEQVRGEDIDSRSDLFSLGVVMYEVVAGRNPFERENRAAILSAITQSTPEPLARYKSDVPDELQRITSKLLEKDPSLRYQSAADMVSDLRRLAVSQKTKIAPPPLPWYRRKITFAALVLVAIVIGAAVVSRIMFPPGSGSAESRMMLAVLPFKNLGAADDDYFADGITDEITTSLARLPGLGVISRQSASLYKNSEKSLREIGKELHVEYVLQGTIRWDKSGDTSRVRITPQLVQVSEDINLWSNNYERALTQIFALQADIATQIASALDIALLASERQALAAKPTENLEAYTYYLRGSEYMNASYDKKDYRIALEMLNRAVELDPDFALAYARRSSALTWLYWLYERTEERLAQAWDAANLALRLNPDLPEAHLALAQYYYQGKRDYDRALAEIEIVKKSRPNITEVYLWTAGVRRRQGQWGETVRNLHRVTELNPRYSKYFWELARTYTAMRDYEKAEEYYDRAIAIAPDVAMGYGDKSFMYLLCDGNATRARKVLEEAIKVVDSSELAYEMADCCIFDGNFERALGQFPAEVVPVLRQRVHYYLTKGYIYRMMNNTTESMGCFDSVRSIIEPGISENSGSADHARLGLAYAGLGRKEEAIRHGLRAVELLPLSEDAYVGTMRLGYLTMIYIMTGKYDAAIDQLEILLAVPSFYSVPYLRNHPFYAPLLDHSRFRALIDQYS